MDKLLFKFEVIMNEKLLWAFLYISFGEQRYSLLLDISLGVEFGL